MALNTNIALGVQTPQFESPMKLALVANQLRESQMKAQEYEAAAQERNALRQLNPADTDYANQLMRVSPTQGIAYRKSLEEAKSAEATRLKSKTETFAAKRGIVSSMMRDLSARPDDENIKSHFRDVMESNLFTDQEKADLTTRTERLLAIPFEERRPFLASQGASASELKPTTSVGPTGIVQSPAFGGGPATVVPGTDKAFQMTPAQVAQNKIAQEQLKVSQGQLATAQSRLAWEKSNPGYELQQTEDGSFVGINKRTLQATPVTMGGTASGEPGAPVKGAPKSKDISVSEQQASYNIARVLNAADEIGKITKKDPKALAPGGTEASLKSVGLEGAANVARSTNRQIVNGAQRDALDALLYLATGAAYNKEQLQGAFEAYIPSYTDDKGTREAKQARMTNLIKDAKVRAGKAWTPKMDAAMSSLTGSSEPAAAADIPAPKGVDASLWNVMTPEERKLWAK